jgi:2-polyprenyl-3-methyl-5-hydroxy-6-metoxy-1,4-benzoquinol methylase
MVFLLDVNRRVLRPEVMDDPSLDPARHARALEGLARINAWSATTGRLWREIAPLARATPGRPLRILDVACGGGDTAVRLARRARRAGAEVEVTGCDVSETALAFSAARARQAGVTVDFVRRDVLQDDLLGGLKGDLPNGVREGYDVLTCSLFLHHLETDEALLLLGKMAAAARRLVLVSDLNRTRTGFALAWAGTRMLSRSDVVHVDGPRSVERAFTVAEARALAKQAGLAGASVARCWPCRWLLRWERA